MGRGMYKVIKKARATRTAKMVRGDRIRRGHARVLHGRRAARQRHPPGRAPGGPLVGTLTNAIALVPASAVGTLLAARRPRNPIGWLTLAILIVGFNPTTQYVILDYRMHHGTLRRNRRAGRGRIRRDRGRGAGGLDVVVSNVSAGGLKGPDQWRLSFEADLLAFVRLEVEFVWWSGRRSLIKNTINDNQCDVLMGVPAGLDSATFTRPYYRSTYVFVSRKDRGLHLASLNDSRLEHWRIGIHMVGDDYAAARLRSGAARPRREYHRLQHVRSLWRRESAGAPD